MPEAEQHLGEGQGNTEVALAITRLRGELRSLLTPGRVGEFDHIELTEVIAMPRGHQPFNVLSVAVLAEGRPNVGNAEEAVFPVRRIRIDGFRDCPFGVARTFRPITALDHALEVFAETGVWALSGQPLDVGDLQAEAGMFAPPDGTVRVPLNNVLKNNFWAGSHVFRLTDRSKERFRPFFDDRRRLQVLSDAASQAVPIAFAGLADLLGDILIQVPVTILVPSVTIPRGMAHADISAVWRSGATPRHLVVTGRIKRDELVLGSAISEHFQEATRLPIDGHRQALETEIYDAEAGKILGATAPTSVIKRISFNMHAAQHEPRLFTSFDTEYRPVASRVGLTSATTNIIGDAVVRDAEYWLDKRQDLEERRRLEETRDFIQYRPENNSSIERAKALNDVRFLIMKHGEGGVDIWDPYLTAVDLLQTLFWCPHRNVLLRGLTDGRDPPTDEAPVEAAPPEPAETREPFPDRQRAVFGRDGGNLEGLRLEYRTRRGPKGWKFHDRFLIFPNGRDGPQAWSLGTSVNSLGKAHHILQRVSNPVMVAGAFQDLWSALDEPQHVVWRSW